MRLQQGAGDRGDPAHLAARGIGLVDPDDPDGALAVVLVGIGDGGAEEHLVAGLLPRRVDDLRSEEHTSELQSLMRISYAVFCLKKKRTTESKQTKSTTN